MKKFNLSEYSRCKTLFKFDLKMKLTTLLLIAALFQIQANNSYSQNTKITLKLDNVNVEDVFKEIEGLSDFKFLYNHEKLDVTRVVSIDAKKERISDILDQLFINTNIYFKVKKKQIILKTGKQKTHVLDKEKNIQQVNINGTVVDASGVPLAGANVIEKGTTNGTQCDFDGKFSIEIADKNAILVISFIGFTTQEIVVAGKTTLSVIMTEDAASLDEVVVTALGVLSKKKSLGYSVKKIGGDDVSGAAEDNLVKSLAGKVAGLQITPAASGIGGSSRVILRGNSSLGGNNQPLYVVDGVPIDNTGFGSASTGGTGVAAERRDYGSGISDINPNDIESVSILKGPNAAALYGNRAANGVILVTTKKGKFKKGLGISYSMNAVVSDILESTLPQFQNEYGQGSGGAFANDARNNWGPKFDGSSFTYPSGIESTYQAQPNNIKDFFKTGLEVTNNFAIQGGNEKANVRFSYSNFNGDGITPSTELNKNTFNLRTGLKLSEKLSIDSKVTYFNQKGQARPTLAWSDANPMVGLYRTSRNSVLQDYKDASLETGVDFKATEPYRGSNDLNPFVIQNRLTNKDSRNRFTAFAKATYAFNDKFSAFVRVGTDVISQSIEQIVPFGGTFRNNGSRSDQRTDLTETNADLLLMYNNKLSENFGLNFNVGGSYRFNDNKLLTKSGENFNIPTSTLYSNLATVRAGQSTNLRSSLYSLYFSGTLDYQEKVYLNVTGRNDWDSQLYTFSGTSSDYSFFYPSVSLSFVGNDILGIEDSVLSFSKLRLSWAEVGSGGSKNDQIFFNLSGTAGYNGLISVSQSNIFDDPNLKPETTKSFEAGLELKFFNNRLYTDITYYSGSTFDQIINAPVDASTGFQFKRTNIGEVSNKGFEVFIGGRPIQSDDFSWDTSVNFSKNESVLESFIEGADSFVFTSRENFAVKTKVGGNYGDIWGSDFTYNADGKLIVDSNGLPIASSEEKLLGNYTPNFIGGFSNTFKYKNLSLDVLVDFRVGGESYDWTQRELAGIFGSLDVTLEGREGMVLDAVTEAGTANTAEISAEGYWSSLQGITSAHLKDLTNVRLRQVSLAYSFPSKALENTFIDRASISLVGRNLLFFSKKAEGVDPEASVSVSNQGQGYFYYNLPSTKRIGVSLNVSF